MIDYTVYGMCFTAPLYIDSLRHAATDSNTDNLSWKLCSIPLYHKKFKKSIAQLNIRIAFQLTLIPPFVMEPVEKLFYGNQQEQHSTDNARIELGLKQAFLLADADKSNFVSAAEVRKNDQI
jgi:hypothetical protein